jgi:hypothetical protein
MSLSNDPGLSFIAYPAAPDSSSSEALSLLASWSAPEARGRDGSSSRDADASAN